MLFPDPLFLLKEVSMKSRRAAHVIGMLGMNVAGNFLLAISVCAFVVPFGITVGGATGVGIIMQKWQQVPTALTVLIVNIICLPLAWFFVGRRLVAGSLLASFVYPLAISLVERIPHIGEVTDSLILATIFAGVIGGAGVGLVMKSGGSTGGLDIPPLILIINCTGRSGHLCTLWMRRSCSDSFPSSKQTASSTASSPRISLR